MHAATVQEIKSEIVLIDVPLNDSGEPIEDTCSVFIEDPILLAIKHEEEQQQQRNIVDELISENLNSG